MHKLKLASLFFLLGMCLQGYSQRITTSPLSRYSYGDMYVPSLNFSQMGGIGNGIRSSRQINFVNPANHSAINKETFLFEVGTGSTIRNIEQDGLSASIYNTGIEYFALAFPVISQKWGTAIGLVPFNSIGYSINAEDSLATYNYTGTGGINQLVLGNSFTLVKGLSVGFHASYLFGTTRYSSFVAIPNEKDSYNTRKYSEYKSNGLLWDFGLQYQYKLDDTKTLTFGATYRDKQTIGYSKTTFLGSYYAYELTSNIKKNKRTKTSVYTAITEIDTVEFTTVSDLRTDIPQQISVGLGFEIQDKLRVGVDAGYQNWNSIYVYKQTNKDLSKENFVKAGIEFIPNKRSTNYIKRIPIRVGGHYNDLPISYTFQGSQMRPKEFGITFGTELFLKQTANSLNVSFDLGKRGDFTNSKSLIESFCIMKMQINLQETWFFQRKID